MFPLTSEPARRLGGRLTGRPLTARSRTLGALVVTLAVMAPGAVAVAASPEASTGADQVSVFASAPAPGHPFGIAVEGDRVYVSTSAGDFFSDPEHGGHKNSEGERVFVYDLDGTLLETTTIETMPDATMGLFGLALDGNPEPDHHLYVADMNGRILRLDLGQHPATAEPFSQTTIEGGWMASMWNDLTFDAVGNLYVPDDKPRIWRVSPDGEASIWFTDDRLTGGFPFAGGPLGGRIDPSREWLYVSITVSGDLVLPRSGHHLPRPAGGCARCVRSRARPRVPGDRPSRAAAAHGSRVRGVRQPLREPARTQRDRGARPQRGRDAAHLRIRGSIPPGGWRSWRIRCW